MSYPIATSSGWDRRLLARVARQRGHVDDPKDVAERRGEDHQPVLVGAPHIDRRHSGAVAAPQRHYRRAQTRDAMT